MKCIKAHTVYHLIGFCSKELMYQQTLRRFAHFNAIQLSDPAPLSELILLALQEEDLDPENNEKDHLKERIAEVSSSSLCIAFYSTCNKFMML